MSYSYKPADAAIVAKLDKLPDAQQIPAATNYLIQGALSPDAFNAWNQAKRDAGKNNGKITVKVARSGAVSLYGLGRWPVTLYAEQWERVLADGGKFILDYIASNPVVSYPAEAAKGNEPAKPAVEARIQRKSDSASTAA